MGTKPTEITVELIASMRAAPAIVHGEAEPTRVHLRPGSTDVRAIRARRGLSQAALAGWFGLARAAIRGWEQGLRRPGPAARKLLPVIGRSPDVVAKVVAETRAA